ncbi:MDS3 [Candida oxycetoniae]|uniref:MDS3 n=1 Tax=Candida oxycetoniae TaxID=497107 RepID=A0AAI9WZA1_9ASCO|nr:MDS3 [Candida oxycetoniae]KAI3405695.2 MDS3 [Candida oxycetoniae]
MADYTPPPPKKPSIVSQSSYTSQGAVSFEDYIHYAAPKSSNIRSVFPPSAVTLGRNAFDRYGELLSDFEIMSSNGDKIPVSMKILLERWGIYFARILARGYVQSVEDFQSCSTPQFRIPFQNEEIESEPSAPLQEMINNQLKDVPLPPQLPMPTDPVPPVPSAPTSYRTSSPRASLSHTLSALRNIPVKSPKASPRASLVDSLSYSRSSSTNSLTEENKFAEYVMEPALIPRKLYIPFPTPTIRAFCDFLYTGQVGNKWAIAPTLLDNFLIGKFYKVPSLYEGVRDILISIIKRKEKEMNLEVKENILVEVSERGARLGTGYLEAIECHRQADKNRITVGEMVEPKAAYPPESVIDGIHESSVLVGDMDLFLRTSNLKIHMENIKLNQSKGK